MGVGLNETHHRTRNHSFLPDCGGRRVETERRERESLVVASFRGRGSMAAPFPDHFNFFRLPKARLAQTGGIFFSNSFSCDDAPFFVRGY